jgi:hypothetical protein
MHCMVTCLTTHAHMDGALPDLYLAGCCVAAVGVWPADTATTTAAEAAG